MTRTAIISIAVLCGIGGAAFALSPPLPECFDANDRHGDQIQWSSMDLQEGAVLTYSSTKVRPNAECFSFEDCRTGKELRVSMTVKQTADWTANGERIQDTFYSVVNSDKAYSMRDLRRAFRKAGYTTDLKTHRSESCGCNTFFPQLRGNKTLYEANR